MHLNTHYTVVENGVLHVTREYILLEREHCGVKYLVVLEEKDQNGKQDFSHPTQHFLFIPGQYLNYLFGHYWPKEALTSTAFESDERLVEIINQTSKNMDLEAA